MTRRRQLVEMVVAEQNRLHVTPSKATKRNMRGKRAIRGDRGDVRTMLFMATTVADASKKWTPEKTVAPQAESSNHVTRQGIRRKVASPRMEEVVPQYVGIDTIANVHGC